MLCLISRSISITQLMPRSFMASESWMCCDLNSPCFTNSTLTSKRTIAIAIINTDMSRVSIIFCNFAVEIRCKGTNKRAIYQKLNQK